MKVSRQFLRDFAEIANRYGWTADDIEEVKTEVRAAGAPIVKYLQTLAAAHRAGYEQTRENGYIRLHSWCVANGWSDPAATTPAPDGAQISGSDISPSWAQGP